MNKKTLIAILSALMAMCLSLFAFSACAGTTVTISQESATIIIGSTLELTATASDDSQIEWESSDNTIAAVNKSGIVTGRKEGTVTITASAGEASATCEVTVTAVEVTLSQTSATIERGETLELTATASDNGTISWSSSNESVATVNNGVITALKEGTATITAKRGAAGSATCQVTVVWNNKPDDYAEISFGEETVSAANPGTWYYWNDQNWLGTYVTVANAEYANGAATFTYSGAASACWFGMQIFYKSETTQIDKNYKLACTITSAVAGDITVNGTVITLVAGENQVEVFYTETANNTNGTAAASLSIQCGNSVALSVIAENTISISNLTFTEYTPEKLSAPTSLSISSDKVATIGEVENAQAYTLLFCQEDTVKYSVTLQNGESFDDSTMEDGTYDVKAIAVGSGTYQSSDASAALTTYTVSNGAVTYDLFAGGEVDAVANAGKYYYWTEFSGIINGKYENGAISFEISNGGNWYSNQIFFKNSALTNGTQYTLTLNINSTVAGKITVNGTVVDLVVGDNAVSVTYTEGANSASLSVQIGTYDETAAVITAGSFVISNVNYQANGGQQPSQPEGDNVVYGNAVSANIAEVLVGQDENTAVANAGKIAVWYDQNWSGSNVTMNSATLTDGALCVDYQKTSGFCWFGIQIFYKNASHVVGGKYKVSFTLNSEVAGDITVNGKVISLTVGENLIEVEYVESAMASLSIQMGVNAASTMIDANVLTISNLTFAAEA